MHYIDMDCVCDAQLALDSDGTISGAMYVSTSCKMEACECEVDDPEEHEHTKADGSRGHGGDGDAMVLLCENRMTPFCVE